MAKKLFKICDPDDYTYKVMIYTGKEKGASENDVRASDGVVLSHSDEYLDEKKLWWLTIITQMQR